MSEWKQSVDGLCRGIGDAASVTVCARCGWNITEQTITGRWESAGGEFCVGTRTPHRPRYRRW